MRACWDVLLRTIVVVFIEVEMNTGDVQLAFHLTDMKNHMF